MLRSQHIIEKKQQGNQTYARKTAMAFHKFYIYMQALKEILLQNSLDITEWIFKQWLISYSVQEVLELSRLQN